MESKIEIKVEPADNGDQLSPEPIEQNILPSEAVHVKSEPIDYDENEGKEVKNETEESSSDEACGAAVEQLTVKIEPKYYSSENECESPKFDVSLSGPSHSDDSPPDGEAGPSNRVCFYDIKKSWLANEQYNDRFDFAYDEIPEDFGDSDYHTDTSISDASDDEENNTQEARTNTSSEDSSRFYYGRNKFKWSKTPVNMTLQGSDVPEYCFPTDALCEIKKNPYAIWKYFMGDILKDILKWTNIKIGEIRSYFKTDSRPEFEDLDFAELEAFFGILMFGALVKVNHHHPNSIFDQCLKNVPIFLVTMSKDRFLVVLNCLQFGDPENGNDPSGDVNIGLIYERAFSKCLELYQGSQCAMVMDTPVMYYGDTLPEPYLESTFPDGFRMTCLCDTASGFIYSCYIPYKDLKERDFNQQEKKLSAPTQQVLVLTKQLHGFSRNITCNKKYTSLELIQALLKKKMTCVGTIKKDKKEIPVEFLPSKQREDGSTLYGFTENITLMSLMKNNKAIIIASSKHHKEKTMESDLPEMLEYYSATIQFFEQGDEEPEKTTTRRTKLLSMALFYRLLDISMYNTHVLLQLHCGKIMREYQTMQKLAQLLVYDHVVRRAYDVKVPLHLRLQIIKMMSPDHVEEVERKKGTCTSCPTGRKRRTSRKCIACQRFLCRRCSHVICDECNKELAARF